MARLPLLLLLALAPLLADAAAAAAAPLGKDKLECVYTVYAKTATGIKTGTDARIGLTIGDAKGRQVEISDLQSWGGLMGPQHDYFESGNLDAFSGRGPCGLSAPLCRLNLTSNGKGAHHGWYCDYVEVTATGPHVPCKQTLFYVNQWLADDAPPYKLYAIVDGCDQVVRSDDGHADRFVVGGVDADQSTGSHSQSI